MAESLLANINSPEDLRRLPAEKLIPLCQELRDFIIEACAVNPGHLGASLGTVELTVALHYVLNTPYDNLIWDVGHQAYSHKILTGRRDSFSTRGKMGGIAGFPRPEESPFDAFGTGHSSTSISAALGMAVAAKLNKEENRQTVAVIGDGSMTGGEAFEGLNNASVTNPNLLIILNDNRMAIDPNVGGLSQYLLDISTSKSYNYLKEKIWQSMNWIPRSRKMLQNFDNNLKSAVLKESNLFESLGIRYFGPIDGHDVDHLVQVLGDLKQIKGVKLLHCITTKGKGFPNAEKDPSVWHAPGRFNSISGDIDHSDSITPPKFQEVFGKTLVELATANEKIIGVTPAMPKGCSMDLMMKAFPNRSFDVGIAEQHAVTFSAGMAARGFIPFCNIYSTFMQRAFDQVIHDVALQRLRVIFCLDRGGAVGADGSTHQGAFDLAYMRCIPNMIVAAPFDEVDLRNMMYTAVEESAIGPLSIRYPRGCGSRLDWQQPLSRMEIGKGRCLVEGSDIAVLSIGAIGTEALKAVQTAEKSTALYDIRFLKPIDEDLLHTVFQKFKRVITVEDGTVIGGLGSAVAEFKALHKYTSELTILGIPDQFLPHGSQKEQYQMCGYDATSILKHLV